MRSIHSRGPPLGPPGVRGSARLPSRPPRSTRPLRGEGGAKLGFQGTQRERGHVVPSQGSQGTKGPGGVAATLAKDAGMQVQQESRIYFKI